MLRRTITLFLVLLGEVGALVLLLRVPTGTLGQIPSLAPEDAVVAAVRVLALILAGWLAASTVLYAIASATRLPALVRSVGWVTLPGVRRLVDGVVATAVVATSTLAVPGTASAMPSGPLAAEFRAPADGHHLYVPRPAGDPDTVKLPAPADGVHLYVPDPADDPLLPAPAEGVHAYAPHPAGDPDTVEPPAPSPPSAAPTVQTHAAGEADAAHGPVERIRPAPALPGPTPTPTYVLRATDHLWSVAASQVALHTGKRLADLSSRDIAPYWVRLVDLNRRRLGSGDPDVVYPGETVLLPNPDGKWGRQ
ncbi:MAG: hypothetical protein AB1679_18920 [Actinomycetota bacterium]